MGIIVTEKIAHFSIPEIRIRILNKMDKCNSREVRVIKEVIYKSKFHI